MRYAVIGSNSFTGSHFIDQVLQEPANEVIGISRSREKIPLYLPYKRHGDERFSFYQCNVFRETGLLLDILDTFKPDFIINYAALTEVYQSILTPVEYFETNTVAVVQLCHELSKRDYLKRYIHISSAEIYGDCVIPVTETIPPEPTTPYAVSKLAADLYLSTLFKHTQFPVILIRTTNVYGAHQQLYKIIPRSIIRLKKGEKIQLHGGGAFVRPFIHVRDACAGVQAAIERGRPGEVYNFSIPEILSIGQVVKAICDRLGFDFYECTESLDERTGNDARYWLDYKKAQRELRWEPNVRFGAGLEGVITWIEENWDEIQTQPLVYVHKE